MMVEHRCDCGTLVWAGGLPRYAELIICPGCGRDNSRAPSLRVRLRWGLFQIRKRFRLYGLKHGFLWGPHRLGLIDAFRLERERRSRRAPRSVLQRAIVESVSSKEGALERFLDGLPQEVHELIVQDISGGR